MELAAHGLEIAYQRVGDGPPLVFLHGAAGDSRLWQPQLAALVLAIAQINVWNRLNIATRQPAGAWKP